MHLSVLSFRIAENKKGPLFKVLFNHFVHFFYTFLTVFNGTVFLVILKCVIGTVGNLAAPFLKLVLSPYLPYPNYLTKHYYIIHIN